MSIEKLERLCESRVSDINNHPHVMKYGVYREGKEMGIAVVCTELNDEGDSYTEISANEKKQVTRLFHPHRVRFYPNPMLTFQEWIAKTPQPKNPIIGKEFRTC